MAARAGAALRLWLTASGFVRHRRENYTTSWDTIYLAVLAQPRISWSWEIAAAVGRDFLNPRSRFDGGDG